MPLFSYFIVVGSLLTGLLIFTSAVAPSPGPPIRVSQTVGLPEPYRAPAVEVVSAKPVIASAAPGIALISVEPPVKAKKPANVIRTHTPLRVVREPATRGRYAAYLPLAHERDLTPQ